MKDKKSLIAAIAVFGASAALLAGGTYAWYQFTQTASVTYDGASASTNESLGLGVKTTNPVPEADLATYGLTKDPTLSNVYWMSSVVSAEKLSYLVSLDGFATNEISPVTSNAFDATSDDTYTLNGSYNQGNKTQLSVDKQDYVEFTFVFKTLKADSTAIGGKDIFLGNVSVMDAGVEVNGNMIYLSDAIRIGYKNIQENGEPISADIINNRSTALSHRVSGMMDLNADGVWDTNTNNQIVCYGEESVTYNTTSTATSYHPGSFDPINHKFLDANIANGSFEYVDYTPKTASSNPVSAHTQGGIPIATTDDNGLAFVTFNIWLEGWDSNCINSVSGLDFSANLNFVTDFH